MNFEAFFAHLDRLPKGDRAVLKREAGTMLSQADGRALRVFYQFLPRDAASWQEDRIFAAACLHCLWDERASGRQPLEQIFSRMGRNRALSGSLSHRLETILDLAWSEDGFLLTKLTRLIHLVRHRGYAVDCNILLQDLLAWNGDRQTVQLKWARALYAKPEENPEQQEGE